MISSQNGTKEEHPAKVLGQIVRTSRKRSNLTIAELAERIGRPREWLNRVELGYSELGEHKPPNSSDISTLISVLGSSLVVTEDELYMLGRKSEDEYKLIRFPKRPQKRKAAGKVAQVEVIVGEMGVSEAILDLIKDQHSDAIIRNTGVRNLESYTRVPQHRVHYAQALGDFFTKNPDALFKRVEFSASPEHLEQARLADERLAVGRSVEEIHNAKVKFRKLNPFHLHVIIGQREAIITFPQSSAQSAGSIALLVRDKLFVEALRTWYDEVLWEGIGPSEMVDFSNFDDSFKKIKKMYGFDKKTG